MDKLFQKEEKKLSCIFIVSIIFSILSYNLVVITGVTSPDGICEGLTYYTYADWASQNGRWAIRYLNKLTGNVVIPIYSVMAYCICICFVAWIIVDIFKIKRCISIAAITAIMIVSPCVIAHFLYIYMALAYGAACFLSAFFVWVLYKYDGWIKFVIAAVSLAVAIGLYQSYIGFAVLLILMLLFKMTMENAPWKIIGKQIFDFLVGGVGGCILYLIIMKIDIRLRHLEPAPRTASFSLKSILTCLPKSFISTYEAWGTYFQDEILHRNIIYNFIFIILLIFICLFIIDLLKLRRLDNVLVLSTLLALIPAGANIIGILIPSFQIHSLMQYQYVLIVPFTIMIMEQFNIRNKLFACGQIILHAMVFIVVWTYFISANATYRCYKMSYDHINFKMSLALSDVYDLPDYIPSETRIIFGGFPNADEAYENIKTYRYAIHYMTNPVFWIDMNGANANRYWYLMNYFGVDGGYFSYEEYDDVIYSTEFINMPIWPSEGSVKMINGFAVIKFTDTPPTASVGPE